MEQPKKMKKLPVHVVEQHNDVLPFIHRAIASRRLPFNNIPMLHFDSHPDLLLPTTLEADVVFEPQKLYERLSIENWLLPLSYAKHVNHVIWVKPPWAKQIKTSEQIFSIGKCSNSGNIRLSSKENYFLTDGLFQTPSLLKNKTDVKLSVVELLPEKWPDVDPCFTVLSTEKSSSSSLSDMSNKLQDDLKDSSYILDVDLDFFSTANPFKELLRPEEEQALGRLYRCTFPLDTSNDSILAFTKKRQDQLLELERVFSCLNENWSDSREETFSKEELQTMPLSDLVGLYLIDDDCDVDNLESRLYEKEDDLRLLAETIILEGKTRELNFILLHDFGCTLDDTELPHHISTTPQIEMLNVEFASLIESLPRPTIVTISRSCDDGYCPKTQVDECQKKVLSLLEKLHGSLNVTYDYG